LHIRQSNNFLNFPFLWKSATASGGALPRIPEASTTDILNAITPERGLWSNLAGRRLRGDLA
jgi:hypothetical protein